MTEADPRATVRAEYDTAADRLPGLTVLNYGFNDAAAASAVPATDAERYCLQLYEHVVDQVPLEGAQVLEVSCGRGGGAAFIARTYAPARYLGIDLSPGNVRLARERFDLPNLEFAIGEADALGASAAFDVVINVEASHLYPERRAFFAEVFRVLKPGGHFCYADGRWQHDDVNAELAAAGFELMRQRDITPNVIEALELDSARREAVAAALDDEPARTAFLDWSGVVGYRAYTRLASGEARYESFLLKKPA